MIELRRGQVVIVATGRGYAGKPRPALILQSERYLGRVDSVTVALVTTTRANAPLFRIAVAPNEQNGLSEPSFVCVDKIMTIEAAKVGRIAGSVSNSVLRSVEDGVRRWLDL